VSVPRRFGELLVERGFISADQLREGLRIQAREKKRLGQILVEMAVLSPDQLNWALSELLGVPYVDLTEEMVDLDVARTMPEEVLRRHQAIPVLRVGNELTVILADPTDRQAIMELEALAGATVRSAMASSETIGRLLDKAFSRSAAGRDRVRYAEVGVMAAPADADVSAVSRVYGHLIEAFRAQASELHFEPSPQDVRVRARIDGQFVERARFPRGELGSIIFRFRVLAGVRGESLPMQARVRTRLDGQEVELDILFFPTLYGESVAVSIWRRSSSTPSLDGMGIEPAARAAVARILDSAGGLVFVTGWEPRARVELLYAAAQSVAAPVKKVLTVERAVSFVIPEFVQVEVPGDFGAAAATILTQPVDVALIEDVGSPPACQAALGSAEQGALVLGGLAFATNRSGLAHLLTLDLPRGPLLAATRGLVHVRRRGPRYEVETLPMTEALRAELATNQTPLIPWTSPTS
jgi:type IV pilus assembly protein PilB